ncbi:MAG: DUF2905 domain-containing protein [Rubrobacteraceae bacterium]|nr:DUF2905 domain-containing protein [Rubrobacteraceae bacterium]
MAPARQKARLHAGFDRLSAERSFGHRTRRAYNRSVGLEGLGRLLIGGAVVLLVLGGLFLLLGRLGVDRLPGDLVFRRGNATFYFPIGLMILLSVVGTIVLNIVFRR